MVQSLLLQVPRMTELNTYQNVARATAIYPRDDKMLALAYVSLGLGEVGEFQGKVKKIIRDEAGVISPEKREALAHELGDILWYVANAAAELGYDLEWVARENMEKLASRAERGVLTGSGDNR